LASEDDSELDIELLREFYRTLDLGTKEI